MTGGAAAYGNIDRNNIATAGHSRGGLEALSTAYHDYRVKRILMFDISIFEDDKRYLLQAINVPVAWFEGSPLDFTLPLAQKDYPLLNPGLPAILANLDTGHYGTFFAVNGGKVAKATVTYLN
ncbi:hypothetical protein G7Y89_g9602 [Cudoniella acicularis]|uniref:Uncharacterized protein n=1 Tax=Cudoniella acicularis TaxID=354080 RepID=A0A8H4REC4_9HELO|nr:hypothetical protein G7Y89_g9602 [Cudoniella acicularis]